MFEEVEMVPEHKTRVRSGEDGSGWRPIATADRYKHPSLDLYDPAYAGEYGVSWDGYWNDADGTEHSETGGHWVASVWCNSCSDWHATRINPTHWRMRPAAPTISDNDGDLSKFPIGAFDSFDVDAVALNATKKAECPLPGDGFTLEQWRTAGKLLSECMEHGECTEGELIRVVLDALGIPSIKPELILRDMLDKQS